MADSKLLDYHESKSGMIIMGGRKFQKKIKESLAQNPVYFCGKPMQVFESERYLGEIMGKNISESVFLTILKRKGLVMRIISEIRVTLDDCRSDTIGGITVGLEIWRKAVMPFLYNNSDCWIEAPKKALNLLDSITHSFFRSLFHSAKGNPLVMYYWDTCTLLTSNLLMLKKLLFLHHLISLPNSALASEIYSIQQANVSEFPGLVSECNEYLEQLGISSNPAFYTKFQWARLIKSKIHDKNKTDILSQMSTYSKLDFEKLSSEEYGMKNYLSSMKISEARTMFSARSSMLSTVQYNFKNHPEYKANAYKCKCGDHVDTQSSLLTCKLYSHLREGLDLLHSDSDLVKYYQLVISERQKEET